MHVPVISTAHINASTSETLDAAVRASVLEDVVAMPGGWLVYGYPLGPTEDATTTPDLVRLRAWAGERGYSWIRLDADGDLIPELPTFVW